MNRRRCFVAQSANPLILAWLLTGCGDYAQPKDTAAGGSGGQAPTGGGSGTSQSGTGGASGSGQGGTTGGTGAQAGAGASGASGQAGGGAGGSGADGGAGGTAGGGACADVAACGGDLTGTWTVGSCPLAINNEVDVTGLGLVAACKAPISSGSLQLTGTLTFVAGGTYMDGTTSMGQVAFELGPECLEISGTETTCDDIDGPILSVGFTTLTCMNNTTTMGCTCMGTVQQSGGFGFVSYDAAQSGMFTTANNEVSMTSFNEPAKYSYCVGGNTLTMNMVSIAKTGTVDGPIVLTKQ